MAFGHKTILMLEFSPEISEKHTLYKAFQD